MLKLITMGVSGLLGVGLLGLLQPPPPPPGEGPPPKAKKGKAGPEGDLHKAYNLLRRLKSDESHSGRPEERLRDWTERAANLYREGIKAADGDPRLAHEYGAAAHDLARAIDHARNAAQFDKTDPDLPPPPDRDGPEGDRERSRRDLRHAYDRIQDARGEDAKDGRFYLDAARDLYRAARKDAEAGRDERAGELARAAEAMTHVPEHLAHIADGGPEGPRPKGRPGDGPEGPKGERPKPTGPRRGDGPPPPPPDRREDGPPPERKGEGPPPPPDRRGEELPPPLFD